MHEEEVNQKNKINFPFPFFGDKKSLKNDAKDGAEWALDKNDNGNSLRRFRFLSLSHLVSKAPANPNSPIETPN